MTQWPLVCALSLAVGASIGWSVCEVGNSSEPIPAPHPLAAVLEQGRPDNERGMSLTNDQAQLRLVVRDELHAALKEELAAAMVGKNFNAPATAVVPASPATPQLLAQRQEALGEVDAVIAGGKWSNDDRRRFHQSVAMLDPQQAQEAFQRLGDSIKNGSMKLGLDQ